MVRLLFTVTTALLLLTGCESLALQGSPSERQREDVKLFACFIGYVLLVHAAVWLYEVGIPRWKRHRINKRWARRIR
jgi:hypothetical protein